jgi:hypothetical protein
MNHTIKLEQDEAQQIKQIEKSVIHYSVELGKIAVVEAKIKESLIGFGEARHKIVESILKNSGFALDKVAGVQVNPDSGFIVVEIIESQSEPEGPTGPDPVPEPTGQNGPPGPIPSE